MRAVTGSGGRLHFGTVAGIKSERWPTSNGNPGRIASEFAVVAPQVAIGDGALGFWKALDEAFPTTRHQRCWLHKTLNVPRQAPEVAATQCAQGSARDLAVAEPGRGGSGDDDLRREIRAQIRQGRRMPDQGSADTADVLRPSRRSFGPLARQTSNPIESVFATVRHRTVRMKGGAVAGHRASHGVQTGNGRVQDLAAFERSKPVAESRQRYKVQGRNRSCRRNQIRRLIHAVTDFPA